MNKKVGFTTSIPVEILFATSIIPVDLNNIFISSKSKDKYIEFAESIGFNRNYCAWIKGIYGAIKKSKISEIIGVVEGDCSSTLALLYVLQSEKIRTIPFSYPVNRNKLLIKQEIEKLIRLYKTSWTKIYKVHKKLQDIRNKIYILDKLSYKEKIVTGFENHFWQVSSSDFMGNINLFEHKLDSFLSKLNKRKSFDSINIGYIGVPPIIPEIYDFIEKHKARVVFNETQRQFTFPYLKNKDIQYSNFKDLYLKQYLNYTYPYDIFFRLKDIKKEIKKRNIKAIIHYTQSFCHKQAFDIIIRKELNIPILTLEEDKPGILSNRLKIRLEAFLKNL